jgi:hypothetical protein
MPADQHIHSSKDSAPPTGRLTVTTPESPGQGDRKMALLTFPWVITELSGLAVQDSARLDRAGTGR